MRLPGWGEEFLLTKQINSLYIAVYSQDATIYSSTQCKTKPAGRQRWKYASEKSSSVYHKKIGAYQ
ncbi:MAG: hypothetical protein BBJ57_03175 [Desulfobacterales bacterium PC51MH44]|nr:MAG: hypothetical protein BBJ57_03175 [Desulfobacterales bacterium PC51MH44]